MSTFKSSRPAVLELAAKYKELVVQLEGDPTADKSQEELDHAESILFIEICEICLWGNATDLSLLTTLSYEDIQKLQGSEARKSSEKNIVANDLPQAFRVLKDAQARGNQDRQVDIVLDNAGFELFVDLILAGYLLSANLASNVVLHCKSIPWFVSDVVPADFASLLNALAGPQAFYSTPAEEELQNDRKIEPLSNEEVEVLSFLFNRWSGFHQEGRLVIRPNRFWTQAGSYWRLPKTNSTLYEDLKQSELVIFKGDLNYRKLTGDVRSIFCLHTVEAYVEQALWPPTTPFSTAIGPLGPDSGVRILTLRTCKADVVVGLSDGEDERLKATEGGGGNSGARKWAWSGKWAVVQFNDGKE